MQKKRVAVVGSGYMGGGIAQTLAVAGHPVVVADVSESIAAAALERLLRQGAEYERDGLWPAGSLAVLVANLSAAPSIEHAVAEAEYITEAVPEQLDIKTEVLARISAAASPDAVIGSNTSAIRIATLASAVDHPERFLGVHWFNPAPFLPLVELIGRQEEVLAEVEEMLHGAGKVTVRAPDVAGFLGNRLQFALYKEALAMVEEGLASAEEVDLVVSNSFGYRLPIFGPIAVGDIAGLDVYLGAFHNLEEQYGPRFAAPASLEKRVASGDLGVKQGGGFREVDASHRDELAHYRDRAYRAMADLRRDLGDVPGLS